MNELRPIQTINNKANFSTTSKQSTDDDFYYERNKHILENSDKIDTVSNSTVNKSWTTETLQEQLKNNKDQIGDNIEATEGVHKEAKKITKLQSDTYYRHKNELTEQEQKVVGDNIGINSTTNDKYPAYTSVVSTVLSEIARAQKKLIDSMFKVNSLKEYLPEHRSRPLWERHSNNAEETVKKFNSLSDNIAKLSSQNKDIGKELDNRNKSSYFPQDSSDVKPTEFSSWEPGDD